MQYSILFKGQENRKKRQRFMSSKTVLLANSLAFLTLFLSIWVTSWYHPLSPSVALFSPWGILCHFCVHCWTYYIAIRYWFCNMIIFTIHIVSSRQLKGKCVYYTAHFHICMHNYFYCTLIYHLSVKFSLVSLGWSVKNLVRHVLYEDSIDSEFSRAFKGNLGTH